MRTITTRAVRTIATVATSALVVALIVVGFQTSGGTVNAADATSAQEIDQLAATVAADTSVYTEAEAGAYGDAVQRRVERRADRRDVVRALLPDALQADLAALKDAPHDDRDDLRKQIMSDALDGKYGAKVQAAAEKIKELRSS